MRRFMPVLVLGIVLWPAHARAASFEPAFNLGYAYELQSWSMTDGSGKSLSFASPMHTYTVTDLTGMVLAMGNSLARTNANRYYAEQEAVRQRKTSYSYAVEAAEPHEGTRLGMTVGFGTPDGFGGTAIAGNGTSGLTAKALRLDLGFDLFEFLEGTFAFNTGFGSFATVAPSTGGLKFSTTALPIGLSYRRTLPLLSFILVEPFAHLDWGHLAAQGGKSFDARDYGVTASWVVGPQWRLEGRYAIATMPGEGPGGAKALATGTTLAVGTTMSF